MLFDSLSFAVFFPITVILFFAVPARFQAAILLLASCIFYASYVPEYLLILFLLIVIGYIAGIAIEGADEKRKSVYMLCSILANLGLLGFFKYFNFAIENTVSLLNFLGITSHNVPHMSWLIPLGLSYHTFQSMSYTIEVRAGKQKAERNFLVYALYIMFFPQLAAGPIERPQHMLPQLHKEKKFDEALAVRGLQLMLWGFIKKVVIADRLGLMVYTVYVHPEEYAGGILMFATVIFAIQVYCDFSGYTDIARGCAEVMGFELTENFRRPFFARNLQEFWQRWHISLTSWLRDYLFYPLRFVLPEAGIIYTAPVVLFIVCGLWHGANWTYVIFGLLHGLSIVFLVFRRMHSKGKKKSPANGFFATAGGILATFAFVCFTYIYFRATNLASANLIVVSIFSWLGALFTGSVNMTLEDQLWLKIYRTDLWWAFIFGTILFTCEWFQDSLSLRQNPAKYKPIVRWALYYVALFCIVFFGKFDSRPFIYFQF